MLISFSTFILISHQIPGFVNHMFVLILEGQFGEFMLAYTGSESVYLFSFSLALDKHVLASIG